MKLAPIREITFFLLAATLTHAQTDSNFSPAPTHSKKSKKLLDNLDRQEVSEMRRNGIDATMPISALYKRQTDQLKELVRDSFFVDDSRFTDLVVSTFSRLQKPNNRPEVARRSLLVARTSVPNAVCVGEGTYFVTTGLFSVIENQAQLAAALAHEMAHYELNHMKPLLETNLRIEKMTANQAAQVRKGKTSVEAIIQIRHQLSAASRFSRAMEMEADSLGFIYFRNSGFYEPDFVRMLTMLEMGDSLRDLSIEDRFAPLRFSKYPFKDFWLAKRPSIYAKRRSDYFMPYDSLRTHPEFNDRRARISALATSTGNQYFESRSEFDYAKARARLESIEASFQFRRLDICLYETLGELHNTKGSSYLLSVVGKVFLKLYKARSDNTFGYYVSGNTNGYSAAERQVNNFLYNLTKDEMAELGFHFMNKTSNFDEKIEIHYYLLWQFSKLTDRPTVKKRVASEYALKFPNGKYLKLIK